MPSQRRRNNGITMLNTATLTHAIFSDLTSETATKASRGITECFACRSTFAYRKPDDPERNSRFCSKTCQDGFDAGARYRPSEIAYRHGDGRAMAKRGPGFAVTCPGCDTEFTSTGLRCCSAECERTYRDRHEAIKEAAQVGHEAKPKRSCEVCGKRIARYTAAGRATKAAVRHCSPRCRRMAKTGVRAP
jgi:hypothetical protein